MKKLSIITVTYNSGETLCDCLHSLRAQTMPFQHICVDGGSTDGTVDLLRKNGFSDSKLISEPDKGIYDAMNRGIKMVDGEIVGILNSDDFYGYSEVLADVAAVFEDPMVEACYGDLVYVDRETPDRIVRYWKSGDYALRKFYWGWMVPHPTFFVRKSVYERYGGFKLDLGSAADYEIMLRFLVKHKATVRYINKILVKMRTGGVSNSSVQNRIEANRMDRLAWQVNGLRPYPWTLYLKPLRKIAQWYKREKLIGVEKKS